MKIVKGRGKSRQVWEIPTGKIVANAEPREVAALVYNICALAGIPQ